MYHAIRKALLELLHRNACVVKNSFKIETFLDEDDYKILFYMNDDYNPTKDFKIIESEVYEVFDKLGFDGALVFEEHHPYVLAIVAV